MPNAKSIQVMDLFSGIGGFSLALKGITKTRVFCEMNQNCQKVLRKNHFKDGNAVANTRNTSNHDEIIFIDDVKHINTSLVHKHPELKEIEMITAGFPCTDISIANINGKGIHGEFSGLFSEITRIVDLLPNIQFLFLENSPHIRIRGLDHVLQELNKRHFQCLWTYVNASDVGALHKRRRWYCFCYKTHSAMRKNSLKELYFKKLRPVSVKKNIENLDWKEDKNVPRILRKESYTKKEKDDMIERCRMLGNSIVPQCAAHAWNILVHAYFELQNQHQKQNQNTSSNTSITTNQPLKIFKIQGMIDSKPFILANKQNVLDLTFDDGVKVFKKTRWATPNYSFWHMFRSISSPRCETTFMVQALFEKNTKIHERGSLAKTKNFNKYFVNPHFVEHLMGYPKNWTKF